MNAYRRLPLLLEELLKDPRVIARRAVNRAISELARDIIQERIRTTAIITLIHVIISYIGLVLLAETDLVTNWVRFVYFYVITGSTVGYGDFSPSTEYGQLFVAFWVIPGAISIFAFIVTKLIASIIIFVRNNMSGFGNFENSTDHIVIIGYIPGQTESLLSETKAAQIGCETVIITMQENLPISDKITRVRTTSLAIREDLIRAGCRGAKAIIIMGETDDETMGASLAVGALDTEAHVVVYFRDETKATLVRPHCPNFEFVVSTSVQQVSRAIVDPGASQVLAHLSSTAIGATLNSMDYDGPDTTVSHLRTVLGAQGATLIGFRHDDGKDPVLTLTDDTRIGEEHTLFYIAAVRLPDDFKISE